MNATVSGAIQSKTNWLGLAIILVGFWQLAIPKLIPTEYAGIADIIIGSAVIILRFMTSESLEDKGVQ